MGVFLKMGLCKSIPAGGQSWEDAFATLRKRSGAGTIDELLLKSARGNKELANRAKEALQWLEMQGEANLSDQESIIDSFCEVLTKHLEFGAEERDMVAMHTAIEASFEDGKKELHQSSLLAFGDDKMSAMCRTVGFPTAIAADLVLSGELNGFKGTILPMDKRVYQPILDACEKEGIVFDETVEYF
jgi:hypothetical protein